MTPSEFTPRRIRDVYSSGQFGLSVEVFPPQTAKGDDLLYRTLDRLQSFRPAFVSCTYGAGGSTQARTVEICSEIQSRYQLAATAHFTCVGASRDDLIQGAELMMQSGIRNIMALRGDPPAGTETFTVAEGGLAHANELVELLREKSTDIGIGVAGYPEKHQEAADAQTDLDNLKRKVDAGADAVFTQLFFINDNFFEFRDRYAKAGITQPLIPGIMPITEFARIKRITSMCGAVFPEDLASRLEDAQDDQEQQFQIGLDHAIQQCQQLIDAGVPGIHFYVLNRSQACEQILTALGIGK
ncbi:MAG: methylenetetrahydrofolate reductase [NAD(P)H] [Planctomycetaceae bacterium]|nr:methylenetetrahydrofolate reductase [NAD(P)H] [Planctomycetaceae bacterium]